MCISGNFWDVEFKTKKMLWPIKKLISVEATCAKIYSEMFLRYISWCRLGYVNRKASETLPEWSEALCAESKYIQQSGSIFGAETFSSVFIKCLLSWNALDRNCHALIQRRGETGGWILLLRISFPWRINIQLKARGRFSFQGVTFWTAANERAVMLKAT